MKTADKIFISLLMVCASLSVVPAQTPSDDIMMKQRESCVALIYERSSFDEYWEGARLRSNGTIATLTRQMVSPMIAIGIFDRLNLFVGSPEYEKDVELLKHYADNMTEEWRAIANFWQDGLNTYTPPGHWNRIAKEYAIKYGLNPLRTARMFAYLNMAMMDGGISCWDAKYYYHYPRPINTIPGFKTIAGTPNFPSYTSGHSVFSAAAGEILTYIFPEEGSRLTLRAALAAPLMFDSKHRNFWPSQDY